MRLLTGLSVGFALLLFVFQGLVGTGLGQTTGLGPYQLNQELTNLYQQQLDALNTSMASWNSTHRYSDTGIFLDITATSGPLDTLLRIWQALDRRELSTVNELRTRLANVQPKSGITSADNQNWVSFAFLYGQGAWNGNRFNKTERVKTNYDEVIATKLVPLFAQSPRARELAGVLLHYGYVYYTSSGDSRRSFAEEVQLRFPFPYLDAFVKQQITGDQFLGSATIIIKSFEDVIAQRIQLGSPPPALQSQQPASPPPQVSQPVAPSPTSDGPAKAIRESAGGKEVGTLMVGDVLVFRISTSFDGKSPYQRTQVVADKLNRLIPQGLGQDEIKTGVLSNRPIILARDEVLLTVDEELARANGTAPAALARLWADKLKQAISSLKR